MLSQLQQQKEDKFIEEADRFSKKRMVRNQIIMAK